MTNIIPEYDYLLCKEVKDETGVITESNVADHWQRYQVLAVGKGRYADGSFIKPTVQANDIVYVQRHSEADSPDDLKAKGLYLIQATRVMARIDE